MHRGKILSDRSGCIAALVLALIAGAACQESTATDDDETQVWEVHALSDGLIVTTARAECLPGGACTAKSWTLLEQATFGCTHKVDFDVQFSASSVRLLNFRKTFDSTCSETSTQGDGTGSADGSYPSATVAAGTVTLSTTSPIGPSSGTGNWEAHRVE